MRPARTLLFAASVCLLMAQPAQSAFISWKYNWTRNPSIIFSDSSQTSFIKLTDEPLRSAAGSSDIVATNLNVFSDASPFNPATFTNKTYTLTLFLLDVESNQSSTLNFAGIINGAVSEFSSNLQNQFVGLTEQERILGNNRYTVTIGPYTPPGPPGSTNAGAIAAHAKVKITQIQKTPEPTSLALALIGAPLVGFRVWRKRRKQS